MTVYQFDRQLRKGESGEGFLDDFFASEYDIRPASRSEQRQGIDRHFTKAGQTIKVEYKTDWKAAGTRNAFIEIVSVDTAGKGGWAYTSKADWLIYFIPQNGMLYIHAFEELRRQLPRWVKHNKQRFARNEKYNTHGVLVDLFEYEQFGEIRGIKTMPVETVEEVKPKDLTQLHAMTKPGEGTPVNGAKPVQPVVSFEMQDADGTVYKFSMPIGPPGSMMKQARDLKASLVEEGLVSVGEKPKKPNRMVKTRQVQVDHWAEDVAALSDALADIKAKTGNGARWVQDQFCIKSFTDLPHKTPQALVEACVKLHESQDEQDAVDWLAGLEEKEKSTAQKAAELTPDGREPVGKVQAHAAGQKLGFSTQEIRRIIGTEPEDEEGWKAIIRQLETRHEQGLVASLLCENIQEAFKERPFWRGTVLDLPDGKHVLRRVSDGPIPEGTEVPVLLSRKDEPEPSEQVGFVRWDFRTRPIDTFMVEPVNRFMAKAYPLKEATCDPATART